MPNDEHISCDDPDAAALADVLLRQNRQFGVLFMDCDGTLRGWSRAAHFITGYTAQEAIGQPASLLFVEDDLARKLDEHELATARAVGHAEDERWHARKGGSRFWSSGMSFPIRDRAGEVTGFLKLFRDATHLRARTKYLENMLLECTTLSAQRNMFLDTIAHELRNPLAPLRTTLHLLQRGTQASASQTATALAVMERQLHVLERLVEDLVDLARVNTGKLSLVYQTVNLQALVSAVVDGGQEAAAQSGISLHCVLPTVPIDIEADADRLHQVLANLLNNAIKFTPGGGKVWLTATTDQTHFMIQVKDTGQGISPALLPRIFDMFTQASGGGDGRRGAGLGIGLAVVKAIVSRHGGTIDVRSEGEGKGADFIVRIPQRKPQGPEPEPMTRPPDPG